LPVVVVVLWRLAHRFPDARAFGPALLAPIVAAGVLVAQVTDARRPLVPCALTVTMTIGLIGLADVLGGREPPGHDDGDDHRGGGWPFEPVGPRGGGLPHPDSWEHFEAAFRAHVHTLRSERASVHPSRVGPVAVRGRG
jgi:hypothetical protein